MWRKYLMYLLHKCPSSDEFDVETTAPKPPTWSQCFMLMQQFAELSINCCTYCPAWSKCEWQAAAAQTELAKWPFVFYRYQCLTRLKCNLSLQWEFVILWGQNKLQSVIVNLDASLRDWLTVHFNVWCNIIISWTGFLPAKRDLNVYCSLTDE